MQYREHDQLCQSGADPHPGHCRFHRQDSGKADDLACPKSGGGRPFARLSGLAMRRDADTRTLRIGGGGAGSDYPLLHKDPACYVSAFITFGRTR